MLPSIQKDIKLPAMIRLCAHEPLLMEILGNPKALKEAWRGFGRDVICDEAKSAVPAAVLESLSLSPALQVPLDHELERLPARLKNSGSRA